MSSVVWNVLGRIARSVFRVLTASFMAVIVAAAVYWLWTTIQDRRLEAIVSQTRDWGEQPLPLAAPVTATLKTRCSESRLYYLLTIRPNVKEELQVSKGRTPSRVAAQAFEDVIGRRMEEFRIKLYDRDGFLLINEAVRADRLTKMLDDKRETAGYEVNAASFCDKEVYSRIASWSVGWSEKK